jgi:N-acetylglucosaminyldiphosphoundecaprenol N-acetyl-beta-D-mannosaminyltransferase
MTKFQIAKLTEKLTPENETRSQIQVLYRTKLGSDRADSLENTDYAIELIGSPVTAAPFNSQIKKILEWAIKCESRYVCVANVHMLMEAYWHPEFATILSNADLVTPDGTPLVWMMKLLGERSQNRVAGLDILLAVCQLASQQNVRVFFLGSQVTILEAMRVRLEREFPNLQIAGMEPLPFRPLTLVEDNDIIQKIHDSAAGVVFVSLGCPKQEYWMSEHKGKIQAVTIGLGGAFPVFAGIHKKAPPYVQKLGFEWLYRLIQEPGRLWKRYSSTIPPFIWLACKQLLAASFS